jgi:hypothetical protein
VFPTPGSPSVSIDAHLLCPSKCSLHMHSECIPRWVTTLIPGEAQPYIFQHHPYIIYHFSSRDSLPPQLNQTITQDVPHYSSDLHNTSISSISSDREHAISSLERGGPFGPRREAQTKENESFL